MLPKNGHTFENAGWVKKYWAAESWQQLLLLPCTLCNKCTPGKRKTQRSSLCLILYALVAPRARRSEKVLRASRSSPALLFRSTIQITWDKYLAASARGPFTGANTHDVSHVQLQVVAIFCDTVVSLADCRLYSSCLLSTTLESSNILFWRPNAENVEKAGHQHQAFNFIEVPMVGLLSTSWSQHVPLILCPIMPGRALPRSAAGENVYLQTVCVPVNSKCQIGDMRKRNADCLQNQPAKGQ
eukprot:2903336-Pleurochrysis_carterae.AAC.3